MIEHEGISSRRWKSRIGHIRLGERAKNAKGKEYPTALPYFRFDPEDPTLLPVLHEIYGEQPTRLRIMFLSNDLEEIFPQYLLKFGTSGLLCKGTGGLDPEGKPKPAIIRVERTGEGPDDWASVEGFPCDPSNCADFKSSPPRCRAVASLMYMLPDFPSLCFWQTDTSGDETSVPRLNTRIADLQLLARATGRERGIAGIPLIISLVPIRVKPDPKKAKKTIYVLDLELDQKSLMAPETAIGVLAAFGRTPQPDHVMAPDGLYARSVVLGADPVAERIEMAEKNEKDSVLTQLPDDIVEGVKLIGLTKRQVRNLALRFVDDETGELSPEQNDNLLRYLSGLADLRAAGDDAALGIELAGLNLDEPDEEPEEEKAEAEAEEKPDKLKKSAGALGLDV